jgi:hypothetical protein
MLDNHIIKDTPTEYLAQMIDEVLAEAEGHKTQSKKQTNKTLKEHFLDMYDSCVCEADLYARELLRR